MAKKRVTNTPSAYLVLRKEGKVLMLRRTGTGHFDGCYTLPSGHVEPAESYRACAVREAFEEVGVEVAFERARPVHVCHRNADDGGDGRIDVYFSATEWKGEPGNMEPEKCSDVAWFDIGRLPENTVPYVRKALSEIERGQAYSEEGWNVS